MTYTVSISLAVSMSLVSFLVGAFASLLLRYFLMKRASNVHVISRLYPTLSLARDVYNQVAHKLDSECVDFKMMKLEIKQKKKMQAFEVICVYKSLNSKIFTF